MAESSTEAVARVDELAPGTLLEVAVGGRPVLLANVGGRIFAVDGVCTHEDAQLVDGYLEDETVVCPWHLSRFCLRTGEVLNDPAEAPIGTRSIRVVDGAIFVD
ncbi:non-heme iron oxygenase ferredoxin subunit [Nocardia sp. BMG51109]|uniref:Rieske (2Fe-2S) protein n=1 Tax=Nocardia sp. BMG51109 TaxID=1056816 RepID=UPI00056A3150|nr:non-heme iron oxygenase ferredoxin subunit [Nocardia sp. BMG51109]